MVNINQIVSVPDENFPPDFKPQPETIIQGQNENGEPIQALVLEVRENDVILDLNHPLAGEDLTFVIEILEVQE
jgi:FKBP-type peptidyl-prolyl cis-trans isomerase SlyD